MLLHSGIFRAFVFYGRGVGNLKAWERDVYDHICIQN
jgi:hypothetical protein